MKNILNLSFCIFVTLIAVQTKNLFPAEAKPVIVANPDVEVIFYGNFSVNDNGTKFNETRNSRQLSEEDYIDVEGPYGYLPKAIHNLNKIFKGLITINFHELMHGAFGFAPDETAIRLIGNYNTVMGITEPPEVEETTTEKGKNKGTGKPLNGNVPGAGNKGPGPSNLQGEPGQDIVVNLDRATQPSAQNRGKNKQPFKSTDEEEQDDYD